MPTWKHNRIKPVIGLTGGICSGKSTVASLFAQEGCAVIDSDSLSHEALQSNPVKVALRRWLGDGVFNPDGSVNRKAVAQHVFASPEQIQKLNALIHPRVDQKRKELMLQYEEDPSIRAVVWDSPLLVEKGLHRECDALVFIKVPSEIRLDRLQKTRKWDQNELAKREKLQFPLDNKAQLADYCIDNSGDQASTLRLVRRVLSQILADPASSV